MGQRKVNIHPFFFGSAVDLQIPAGHRAPVIICFHLQVERFGCCCRAEPRSPSQLHRRSTGHHATKKKRIKQPTHAQIPNVTPRFESPLTGGHRPSSSLPWRTCNKTHRHHPLMVAVRIKSHNHLGWKRSSPTANPRLCEGPGFCDRMDFGDVPSGWCEEGMQILSAFPTAVLTPPRQQKVLVLLEKVSCSRVDFHAPRGKN